MLLESKTGRVSSIFVSLAVPSTCQGQNKYLSEDDEGLHTQQVAVLGDELLENQGLGLM